MAIIGVAAAAHQAFSANAYTLPSDLFPFFIPRGCRVFLGLAAIHLLSLRLARP